MIKTIATKNGSVDVMMTEDEIAMRLDEERQALARRQEDEEQKTLPIIDRLVNIENTLKDVINRGTEAVKKDSTGEL